VSVPRQLKESLSAGIDLGVKNLLAVYVENGESFLSREDRLKALILLEAENCRVSTKAELKQVDNVLKRL